MIFAATYLRTDVGVVRGGEERRDGAPPERLRREDLRPELRNNRCKLSPKKHGELGKIGCKK